MSGAPQIALMADGRRLHLQHGPIDIIARATGRPPSVEAAYRAAGQRFATILEELVTELPLLRRHADTGTWPAGIVARRMHAAVLPHARNTFVTPMAAVAGSVAEEVMAAMRMAAPDLGNIFVNNGGDIALHLGGVEHLDVGLVGNADSPAIDALVRIDASSPVRGIATSGWRGRSQSLGIADSVTVLAASAAEADVAATLIANRVNIDHPAVVRAPADNLRDDTDLGDRLVTVHVGRMDRDSVSEALDRGEEAANAMIAGGLAISAGLLLQGESRIAGAVAAGQRAAAWEADGISTTRFMTGRTA
ncbi:MAG: UPF0280 family protein [Rhodospirillales bacterium]